MKWNLWLALVKSMLQAGLDFHAENKAELDAEREARKAEREKAAGRVVDVPFTVVNDQKNPNQDGRAA